MRTPEHERAALLAAYRGAREKLDIVTAALDAREGESAAELEPVVRALRIAVAKAADRYRGWLPRSLLSRCPFTGTPVRHSLDVYGLDGPWWDYEAALRPAEELPPTFFALRGAVRLARDVERVPFLCIPGPEAPHVVTRLLEREEISAVVSAIGVGRHQAYPVFYFADPQPGPEVERVNDWATDRYLVVDERGRLWRLEREPSARELDFDLARWIRAGKLYWIAPGDETASLRSIVSGCPYIGLPGRRTPLRLQGARVWSDVDVVRGESDAGATTLGRREQRIGIP